MLPAVGMAAGAWLADTWPADTWPAGAAARFGSPEGTRITVWQAHFAFLPALDRRPEAVSCSQDIEIGSRNDPVTGVLRRDISPAMITNGTPTYVSLPNCHQAGHEFREQSVINVTRLRLLNPSH